MGAVQIYLIQSNGVAVYQKINGADFRRIFVVGDIHGCLNRLNEQLLLIEFDGEQDLLISVGDLIDRGAQNVECLDLINEKWFQAVRGNHEQMAIDVINGQDSSCWISNGGMWFYCLDAEQSLLATSLIRKAEALPLIIEVNTAGGKYVIAHADYPDNDYFYGKSIRAQHAIWSRERISNSIDGNQSDISGADKFIFGHTPVNRVTHFKNQIYIDTGAVFGHALTIIQIQ